MKIIYIEANAEELRVKPTLATAIQDVMYSMTAAIVGDPVYPQEEDEDEQS